MQKTWSSDPCFSRRSVDKVDKLSWDRAKRMSVSFLGASAWAIVAAMSIEAPVLQIFLLRRAMIDVVLKFSMVVVLL